MGAWRFPNCAMLKLAAPKQDLQSLVWGDSGSHTTVRARIRTYARVGAAVLATKRLGDF